MGGDVEFSHKIQQQIAVHHDKWHDLMDAVGNAIGWANVFWIFFVGALGIGGFLIRKKLKKAAGEYIKFLSDWLNR